MVSAFLLEGSSMLPVFKPGEIVLVEGAGRFLRPGDCAVYVCSGRTLLHRVLKISGAGVWLADDAGRLEPHFVPWEEVRGRALAGGLAAGLPGLIYSRLRRSFAGFFINA